MSFTLKTSFMLKSNLKLTSLLSPRTSQHLFKRTIQTTPSKMQNEHGQGQSHAKGDSIVPGKAQEQLPKGVEEAVPDSVHDTGSSKSHATNTKDSMVPEAVQKAVPEKLERALPESIHPTGDKN